MCTQRHFQGKVGAEAEVGLHHVRPGRQWVHHEAGDARDRHSDLQNGLYAHNELELFQSGVPKPTTIMAIMFGINEYIQSLEN